MAGKEKVEQKPKQKRISQGDIPGASLTQALRVAESLWDHYAGHPTAPHDVAIAAKISPTSSAWRTITGASIAYGLTEGGSNAPQIALTELGRSVVAETKEGQKEAALRDAALKPTIPADFYKQYDRAKWPRDDIAANVLIGKGVPKDRAADVVSLLRENAEFVGFIRDTKTGPFVSLDGPSGVGVPLSGETEFDKSVDVLGDDRDDESEQGANEPKETLKVNAQQPEAQKNNNRVFITHGKDHSTMEQIKEVVLLGGFEPVVSIQRESVAKPIPDKVLDDMRTCSAAIIHVSSESVLLDGDGNEHVQINPNVLIEIGAAMALYRGRFILVVEEGVKLPSNLQGMYESRYTGEELSLGAGMKILKALRGLNEDGTL